MVEGSVDVTKGTVVQLVQISDPHAHYHCEDMLWLECQIQCTQSTADIVECTQSTVLVYSVQTKCTVIVGAVVTCRSPRLLCAVLRRIVLGSFI